MHPHYHLQSKWIDLYISPEGMAHYHKQMIMLNIAQLSGGVFPDGLRHHLRIGRITFIQM